jgi:hypothetical protein
MYSDLHPRCRFCEAQLAVDRQGHLRDVDDWEVSHHCIIFWRKANKALGHDRPGRQSKQTKERAIYHELRILAVGVRTTLQQLGLPMRQVSDIVCHMRHEGIPIKSGWRDGKPSKFGLRVRERVYWLAVGAQ